MQPVGRLFQKFPRLVRELAKDLGKDVELTIEGAETEVDRVVVDSLYDPLVHMLRNSLDHGIEPPAERQAKGKAAAGVISIDMSLGEGRLWLRLRDDGKGLALAFIRRKAIESGLLAADSVVSPDEIAQLIFASGFSTASARDAQPWNSMVPICTQVSRPSASST